MSNVTPRKPLYKLAYASVKAHKWINVKLCLAFACLAVLLSLFTAFHLAIENKRANLEDDGISANYLYSQSEVTDLLAEKKMPSVATTYSIKRYDFSDLMMQYVGEEVDTVTANYVALEVNGKTYHFKWKNPRPLWLYAGNPFNDLDKQELAERFGLTDIYTGSYPRSYTNEALISERILDAYGLTAEDVIGKRIRLYVEGDLTLIPSYIDVTGVIAREYYQLAGHKSDWWQIAPTVVFAEQNRVPFYTTQTINIYTFDSWPSMDIHGVSQLGNYGMQYCGTTIYSQREVLSDIKIIVTEVYIVVGSILAAGLALTVMLMIDRYVNVFSRSAGILLSCGLQQNALYELLFVQIFFIFLLALPIAAVGTAAGYYIITALVSLGTGITLTISVTLLIALILLGAAVVFVVAVVFYGFALLRIRKKTVKQLLGGNLN